VRRNSAKIMTNGVAARWLGANFWSRTGGPLMWRSYDPAIARAELRITLRRDFGGLAAGTTLTSAATGRREPPGEERDLWP